MAEPNSPPRSPIPPPSLNPATIFHDSIPYSAPFLDGLMTTVLDLPPSKTKGRGRPPRPSDIDASNLPTIPLEELPLPLTDPRRKYKSAVPGVLLTHPGGWLEGGMAQELQSPIASVGGTSPYSQEFIARHRITNATELQRHVKRETAAKLEELKGCMRERREALEHNERIMREIKQLEDQRDTERRVEAKMRRMRTGGEGMVG